MVFGGGSCRPGDAVGAGHDAVAGSAEGDGDECFLSCWATPCH
jgi:hypothetical protein